MEQQKIAGRYRLETELGKGSSGVVYKAWDELENKPVALKMFSGSAATSTFSDFLKEIKILSALSHPNLAKIMDAGRQDGMGYLVEEFIDGQTIKEWLKKGPAYDEVVKVTEQIVNALDYVHNKNILHRDIKPTNILVSNISHNGSPEAKLLQKETRERDQSESGLLADLDHCLSLIESGKGDQDFELGLKDASPELSYRVSFVGREVEIKGLRDPFDLAQEGHELKLLVTGEIGVGKSRFIQELKKTLGTRGFILLEGSSNAFSKMIPYSALSDIIGSFLSYCRLMEPGERESWKNTALEALGALGGLIIKINPAMEELIGKQPEVIELEQEKERYRFLTAVSSLFLAILARQPLAIFMDDWQWADENSVALIKELLAQFEKESFVFVGAGRKEELDEEAIKDFVEKARISLIELKALKREDIRKAAAELLKLKDAEAEELGARLYERSGGNPYFFFEIIRDLVDTGMVAFEGGKWTYDNQKLDKVSVPKTIFNLLFSRTQGLSPETRELLKLASVWGKKFSSRELQKISDQSPASVEDAINEAVRCRVLWQEGGKGLESYSFAHDKIQQQLYDSLLQEEKRAAHSKIARFVESQPDKGAKIYVIARHFILAGDKENGIRYAILSADKARSESANFDAAYFYKFAIDNSPDASTPEYTAIKEKLGNVYGLLGEFEKAISFYNLILPDMRDNLRKALIERKIGDAYFQIGEQGKAIEHYKIGLKQLGRRQPVTLAGIGMSIVSQALIQTLHTLLPKIVSRARLKGDLKAIEATRLYSRLGKVYFFLDIQRELEARLKALNLAELTGDPALIANEYALHGAMIAPLNRLDRALRFAKRGVEIAKASQDKQLTGAALAHLGMVQYSRGEYKDSISSCNEGYKLSLEIGDFWEATLGMAYMGLDFSRISDYRASMEICEKGYELSRRVKDYRGMGRQLIQICRNYTISGDLKRAIEAGEEGLGYLEKVQDRFLLCEICFVLGRAFALYGDFDAALEKLGRSRFFIEKKLIMKGPFAVPAYIYSAEAYLLARDRTVGLSESGKIKYLKLAEKYLQEALKLISKFPAGQVSLLYGIKGQIEIAKGNKEKAIETLKRAIEIGRVKEDKYEMGLACAALGEYLLRYDAVLPAKETLFYLKEAERLFNEINARAGEERIRRLLGRYEGIRKPEEQLKERVELTSFFKVSQIISSILDTGRVLEKIMDSIIEVMGAQRGYLFLYRPDNGALEAKVARNLESEALGSQEFEFSKNIIEQVDRTQESVVVTDAQSDDRFKTKKSITAHKLKSILCAPLKYKEKVLGIIYLDNKLVTKLFTEEHLRLLNALASQAAIAIENAKAYHEIEELNESLENKVEDRTKQLKMKSGQLELSNEELKKASKAKSDFMSSMTHELRSPLAAVIGFSDLLMDGGYGQLNPDAFFAVGKMKGAANHLMGLINDLLDMAKIEAGKMEIRPQEFLVKDCLETIVAAISPLVEKKALSLTYDTEAEVAYGDLKRVNQIFWNIISNAVKFTDKGGIEIRAVREGEVCKFSVKDTGIGIPEDKRDKVFALFEQVDNRHKGAGLGMSITKQLVEMHGGKIWFESVVGKGTAFFFTLPDKK